MLVIMPPPDVEKPLLIHRGKQVAVVVMRITA
jgi:hypothetical protein